jgi:CheY-like chemotaxis protein
MRILVVEDHRGFGGELAAALEALEGVSGVDVAMDKETAALKLTGDMVDLVILDLSIPPSRDSDSPQAEHGQALFHETRSLRPGTPIFILTGEAVAKFSRSLPELGNQVRLWGDAQEMPTVSFFLKEEVGELMERVKVLAASFAVMESVVVNTRGRDLGLSAIQLQMLKSFGRTADGVACDVTLLSGGLSDSKVVKAVAIDLQRNPQVICAGKLGSGPSIAKEKEAFERHVRKLSVGACAPLYYAIDQGVGRQGAIFYTLADPDTLSLFERLAKSPDIGPTAIANVRSGLQRWIEARSAAMVQVGDVVARLLDGPDLERLEGRFGLGSLRRVEAKRVHASRGSIHGDLHCGNVFVKADGSAVLIDFGDAGPGFTCLDPVTLELSLIFHPEAARLGLRDGIMKQLEVWPDLDAYAVGDPLRQTIVACREWSHDVGGSDGSVLASAYAYALRQLKYKDVDPALTLAFLSRVAEKLAAA